MDEARLEREEAIDVEVAERRKAAVEMLNALLAFAKPYRKFLGGVAVHQGELLDQDDVEYIADKIKRITQRREFDRYIGKVMFTAGLGPAMLHRSERGVR